MKVKKTKLKIRNVGLEQLFGSKTRVKLLKLFLNNENRFYFVREVARAINSQINSVRHELLNLKELGLIGEVQNCQENYFVPIRGGRGGLSGLPGLGKTVKLGRIKQKNILKKFFQANSDFILFPELKALVLKADFLLEKNFVKAIGKAGNVDYLVLTGNFVGLVGMPVDLFLVGRFNRRKLSRLINDFEKDFGREINYTVMSRQEFRYRKDITDRFLYDILENKKIIMVNHLEKA